MRKKKSLSDRSFSFQKSESKTPHQRDPISISISLSLATRWRFVVIKRRKFNTIVSWMLVRSASKPNTLNLFVTDRSNSIRIENKSRSFLQLHEMRFSGKTDSHDIHSNRTERHVWTGMNSMLEILPFDEYSCCHLMMKSSSLKATS